jgi:membrane fusion protein (multidrug efflux system)
MSLIRCISAIALGVAALTATADAQTPIGKARPSGTPAPTVGNAELGALLDKAIAQESHDISVLVTATEEATLSSQMAGKIKKIYYGLGDVFSAGDLLLEFDCEAERAQLDAAQAEYRGARETHLTKLRLQALGAAGELEVTLAASAADKLKSQVDLRQSLLAYCKVVAPFPGRLVKLRVKAAESVALGQPLLDIANPSTLKAQLFVPASWVRWVRVGTPIVVKSNEDRRTYRARVSKLNARVEGVNQSLELEAQFDGSTEGLLPGLVGTASFPTRPKH